LFLKANNQNIRTAVYQGREGLITGYDTKLTDLYNNARKQSSISA